MYINRELEAKKTSCFAKIAEIDQKRSNFTTNVVNLVSAGYKFDEVVIWLRVVYFSRRTANSSIRDCLQVSKKGSRPRFDLTTVLGCEWEFAIRLQQAGFVTKQNSEQPESVPETSRW